MNAQQILDDLTARGVRIWAEADRLKLDAPVGVVTAEDKAKLTAAKPELIAVLTQPGTCPKCHALATLQQREPLTFWCPGCRIFSNAEGREYPKPVRAQMLCLEVVEARQLVADLMAAGCEIRVTGGEIAISNLGKLSDEIWARLEHAGPDFLRAAREMAEDFKNERGGEWKH